MWSWAELAPVRVQMISKTTIGSRLPVVVVFWENDIL
jgi:hypothetical protein